MGMLDYVIHRTDATHQKVREAIMRGEIPRWIANNKRSRYIASVILSAPAWRDRDALRLIQENCRCKTELSGVAHEVNHIVPLNHPRVCGLTVPWNLEIITAKRNNVLGNYFADDNQLKLF